MNICDVCGNDLYDSDIGEVFKGLEIKLKYPTTHQPHKEVLKVEQIFGRLNFSICFTCWLKSLGVKPI